MPSSRHQSSHLVSFLLHLLPVVFAVASVAADCGGGEWKCGGDDAGGKCISLNKFCDGVMNCENGTDEPLGCTNCNRTFYGESNVKYPLRVTGPFQRYLPFVCRITFVAAGKEFGDFVELTFLSFQIGRLELTKNQTAFCPKGYLKISEWDENSRNWDEDLPYPLRSPARYSSVFPRLPEEPTVSSIPNFGEFCGSIERSATFFSQSNNVSVNVVVPSKASTPSTSFVLYLTYRFLKNKPLKETEAKTFFGDSIPGTYCDREFRDCHSNRRCRIRSPNFPGFYPRNITCHFFVRQTKPPEGYTARIVLSQPNDYKISVPTGRATSTSGTTFLLSTDCISGDSVRVYDGPSTRSPELLQFCGSGSLPEIVSSGNELVVQIYSAPYQHLTNSRVEIEVSVKYEMVQTQSLENNRGCSYTLDGTKQRWGMVHSPRHTMPPNANCTYRFIGASKHDKIWLYFLSFFVHVEEIPSSGGNESSCSISRLEIYDYGDSKANSSALSPKPSHLFCGENGPRLCAHAADYPPTYLPPRPCEIPGESYLSLGSEMVIKHRFLSFASELLTSSTSSFSARYEFVDTHQQGTAIDHSECDRRIDSRLGKKGAISNPRNVFLYGRGGRQNLTCLYHFVGLPDERVIITLKKASLKSNKPVCKTYYDSLLQRHGCKMATIREEERPSWSYVRASEHWTGNSSPVGCVCDLEIVAEHQQVTFESVVNNVKLNFEVFGMSHLEDFQDFFFEASYQFVNHSVCESGLRRHTGSSGDGFLSFYVPVYSLQEVTSVYRPIRCRWKIEASPHKHLYLKFKGFNSSENEDCYFGSRLLVYLDPRGKPIASACVDSEIQEQRKDDTVDFKIFSHNFYNESRDVASHNSQRDQLFVEIIAPRDSASFVIQWLEVTRPFVKTQTGQSLRNVDCLFECPEIKVCIDPELWCDGTMHCPSGYDELPDNCNHFPVTYVSCAAAGVLVVVFVLVAFTIRRRRLQKRMKKKNIRHFLPDDYCIESPIG